MFEEWKANLVKLAQDEGVPIWDFSGYNQFSSENIDVSATKGIGLRWFWEPAHYRKELGDIMLANMFRGHCPISKDTPKFGVPVTIENIEQHLLMLRTQKLAYYATHKSVLVRLKSTVLK